MGGVVAASLKWSHITDEYRTGILLSHDITFETL